MVEAEVAELAAFDVYEANMVRLFGAEWRKVEFISLYDD